MTKEKPSKKVKLLSVEKYEEKIERVNNRINEIYSLMEEEEYYTNQIKMHELEEEVSVLKNELIHLEEEYLLKLEQIS